MKFSSLLAPTILILLPLLSLSLGSCSKKVGPTTVEITDSVRHYYPIVSGRDLSVNYILTNTGTEPLIISDIHPSCGCIIAENDYSKRIVPPGGKLHLDFTFSSKKNLGYVRHTIRLYGNMLPKGRANMVFDVNIVPPSHYTPDYEETYEQDRSEVSRTVEGQELGKGYYVD